MDVALRPEQQALATTVRDLATRYGSADRVREVSSGAGYDQEAWKQLVAVGLAGLPVGQAHGGSGAGWLEVALALMETGRRLLPTPLLGTLLAVAGVLASQDEQAAADLLPDLTDGRRVGALAVAEPGGDWDADGVRMKAVRSDGGWELEGTKAHVLADAKVGLFVVAARDGNELGLFAVEADAPGVAVQVLVPLDQTRPQATVVFSGAPARRLGADASGAVASGAVARVVDLARVLVAAEAAGGAARCLDLTVQHLLTREQFGRRLGTFQALRHRCADVAVEVEAARATALSCAWTAAEDPAGLAVAGPLAKAVCAESYWHAAVECIQLHGGIGFTWEHEAHLHLKRATSTRLMWGSTADCRRLVADRAGL